MAEQKLGVTMPVLQAPIERVADFARMAEDAGLDSAWDYEFYRNPFVMLGAAAAATERITLATGIAVAAIRTPFEMASAAADVDEIANGRVVLGVGIGAPEFVTTLHGTGLEKPVARMREYVEVLRRSFAYLATAEPGEPFEGEYYTAYTLPFNPWGARGLERKTIPVYIGAMGPKMLELAGEVADGTVGYLQTPRYVKEVVLPSLEKGARRAGRTLDDLDITGMSICSVSTDRDEAWRRARIQVGMYIAHPSSERVVKFHGLEADQEQLRMALFEGGAESFVDVTSDELIETFSITGTPDEARRKLAEYDGLLPHMIFHTPYMPPFTVEETEDAFRGILETFGRA